MAEKHAATYHPHHDRGLAIDLRHVSPLTLALLRLDGAIARLQSAGAGDRATIAVEHLRRSRARYYSGRAVR